MQKEPHGEEWRHLKEHSKVDRALSATVIIRFSSLTRCQGLVSRPMLKVKDTDSTVPKTKQVCRRGTDFVMCVIPADDGSEF